MTETETTAEPSINERIAAAENSLNVKIARALGWTTPDHVNRADCWMPGKGWERYTFPTPNGRQTTCLMPEERVWIPPAGMEWPRDWEYQPPAYDSDPAAMVALMGECQKRGWAVEIKNSDGQWSVVIERPMPFDCWYTLGRGGGVTPMAAFAAAFLAAIEATATDTKEDTTDAND